MKKEQLKPEKAYKNLEFLNSSDARTLRILAEFLEPMQRFKAEKVCDTIVFFGSARTKNLKDAQRNLQRIEQSMVGKVSTASSVSDDELEYARNQVFLAQYYEDAVELARRLTEWSSNLDSTHRFVISSGGGPGMMEAANKGAVEGGGKSIGLNISIPTEQYSNPYITPELNFEFHYFFMRKFWFIYLAKALVIFPGGFGTLDELFEVLTLIQTEKVQKKMPIIIYGKKYWDQILNLDNMAKFGVIDKEDLDLIHFCDSVDGAFNYLTSELTRLYIETE
ncbi:MAG: LOG family protein [Bacillota bacterium]|nr:LOG family protein [Bacillota bacterium]MDW7728943.1 LOG family protein [Bacillota bacterium]